MNAQLCNPWLSRGCPNKGESATNVLQSNRRGILLLKKCLYLSSKFVGKFSGNSVVWGWLFVEGVEGSDMFSGSDKVYLKKYLLAHLPSLFHLVWWDVVMKLGD